MFGIGPMEFVLIAVVAVVLVGPDKLPDVLRKFGRFYVQAKRHANDVKSTFDDAIHQAERELELDRIRELQKKIQLASLTNVIDAAHTDQSPSSIENQTQYPLHTADGRLIEDHLPQHSDSLANPNPASAMPPSEHTATDAAPYHEGHLPPHTPQDNHDPFAPASLQNKNLIVEDIKKPEEGFDKDKK